MSFSMIYDKRGDKDKKAELKLLGAKAVEQKDYASASKFYSEVVYCCAVILYYGSAFLVPYL
jgi:hypothetical protein